MSGKILNYKLCSISYVQNTTPDCVKHIMSKMHDEHVLKTVKEGKNVVNISVSDKTTIYTRNI